MKDTRVYDQAKKLSKSFNEAGLTVELLLQHKKSICMNVTQPTTGQSVIVRIENNHQGFTEVPVSIYVEEPVDHTEMTYFTVDEGFIGVKDPKLSYIKIVKEIAARRGRPYIKTYGC